MRLKKVYKHPGWCSVWEFQDWMSRTNPDVPFDFNATYKVAVSIKEGKRRRLRMMNVSFISSGCCDPECFCGGSYYEIQFERSANLMKKV